MEESVFAIIINYKHPEITIQGVMSLLQSEKVNLTIVVVDNNSPDSSYELLKETLPEQIVLLKATENLGFAAGNNIGIKYALTHNADYILLINNDTEVNPHMIWNLKQNTSDRIVTSPKMYYYDEPNKIWFAGGKFYKTSGRFKHLGENQQDGTNYENPLECDFLTGCCFMLTSNVVRKAGLLDESYFMYIEDVDYSLRLKNEGVKLMMIPSAKLWHKVGATSGGGTTKFNIYYGNRNRLYLQKKFGFSFYTRLVTLASRILLMLIGLLRNTNQKYIWYSIIDFYTNRMGKQDSRV